MQTVSLKLEMPSDLLAILRKSRQEMEREIQLWTALELFRQRKVSAGKAAELAGVSLAGFHGSHPATRRGMGLLHR